MPRHLELIESCASCLPHGNSVFSVACDLLYKTINLFFSLTLWLNKTLIHRELSHAKLKLSIINLRTKTWNKENVEQKNIWLFQK